jgi:hypothetical protein
LQIYLGDLQIDYTIMRSYRPVISFESLEMARCLLMRGLWTTAWYSGKWTFAGGPRGKLDMIFVWSIGHIIWVTDANAGTHQSTDGGLTWAAKMTGLMPELDLRWSDSRFSVWRLIRMIHK